MNTTTAIIGFHIHKYVSETSTSHQTFTRKVRESYLSRHPDAHSVEWSNHPDPYEQVEADAQKLARMMPGGPVRMPLDLLPCLLDALPEDRRGPALADLAALLGIVIGSVSSSTGVGTVGELLREAGESVQALAVVFADGKLTEADDPTEALRQLRELQGVTASMIAQLEKPAVRLVSAR